MNVKVDLNVNPEMIITLVNLGNSDDAQLQNLSGTLLRQITEISNNLTEELHQINMVNPYVDTNYGE